MSESKDTSRRFLAMTSDCQDQARMVPRPRASIRRRRILTLLECGATLCERHPERYSAKDLGTGDAFAVEILHAYVQDDDCAAVAAIVILLPLQKRHPKPRLPKRSRSAMPHNDVILLHP